MEQTSRVTNAPGSTDHAPTPPTRTTSRRVGLPTGRAVVGALLVTLAVVGLFSAFRKSQAETGTSYLVVSRAVPSGALIGPDDVTTRIMDLGEIGDRTLTEPAVAIGAVAIQHLVPGQLLQEANILQPGAAALSGSKSVEVSFAVDRSRALNGLLTPGEVVDIVATLDQDGDACSLVVAPKARVVSVRGSGDEVISSGREITLTLALEEDQSVLGLVFAVDESDLTVIRSTRSQADPIEGTFCGAAAKAPLLANTATQSEVDG